MAESRLYAALGEESQRGVKESSVVGFVPLLSPKIPKVEFDDKNRKEFRGEAAVKGDTSYDRMGQRWSAAVEMPFYTEAGSAAGIVGTLLKHFFGKCVSAQNGTTGQFRHMMYPVPDPFTDERIGSRALTLNLNINEGAEMKDWPYVGGRVKAISFDQEPGSALKFTADLFGQRREAVTDEIGTPVFATESLRCDYNNLSIYTGTVARQGTAPDFTGFSFAGAQRIKPDKITVKIENGMEDALRLSGLDYPDRTRMGQFKATVEMTVDWEDPSNGFSSIAEFRSWMTSASTTNMFFHWDTGTQAGTGDSHGLYIDLPRLKRLGGEPDYKVEKDPMITLKYEGLYDLDIKYMAGIMLKNTAAAV